jgi:hypothetical protein
VERTIRHQAELESLRYATCSALAYRQRRLGELGAAAQQQHAQINKKILASEYRDSLSAYKHAQRKKAKNIPASFIKR